MTNKNWKIGKKPKKNGTKSWITDQSSEIAVIVKRDFTIRIWTTCPKKPQVRVSYWKEVTVESTQHGEMAKLQSTRWGEKKHQSCGAQKAKLRKQPNLLLRLLSGSERRALVFCVTRFSRWNPALKNTSWHFGLFKDIELHVKSWNMYIYRYIYIYMYIYILFQRPKWYMLYRLYLANPGSLIHHSDLCHEFQALKVLQNLLDRRLMCDIACSWVTGHWMGPLALRRPVGLSY